MVLVLVKEDRLELRAPFHDGLSYRCRGLGGRWKGAEVGWVFEREHEQAVRVICLDLFGLNGHPESSEDTADVEVTVDEQVVPRTVFETTGRPIAFLGREIAAPLPHKDVARPGRGVKFLKRRPLCRRSVESYLLSIANGSVFTVRAVPRLALDRFVGSIGDAGTVRIVAR